MGIRNNMAKLIKDMDIEELKNEACSLFNAIHHTDCYSDDLMIIYSVIRSELESRGYCLKEKMSLSITENNEELEEV